MAIRNSITLAGLLLLAGMLCFLPVASLGQNQNLINLSIEELMNIEVTSVSRKSETQIKSPAAVFVLTSEDIRRSGYKTLPDLLRLVPGLEVARIDLQTWSVSSRGFSGQFASKLLVMIDGRSVYNSLFSGVYWDHQDIMLSEIDRIEVIRGPGGTMWGANAVNGVINIITRGSGDSKGVSVQAEGGGLEYHSVNVKYGGSVGKNTKFHIHAREYSWSQKADATTKGIEDIWKGYRGGLHFETEISSNWRYHFQGQIYAARSGYAAIHPSLLPPYGTIRSDEGAISAGFAVSRIEYTPNHNSKSSLQLSFEHYNHDFLLIGDQGDVVNADLQNRYTGWSRNDLVWGLGYRGTFDEYTPSEWAEPASEHESNYILSTFIQDEITLIQRRLNLILGIKFEENNYTELEFQPNLRLLWTPADNHVIWTSVSRAVRIPSSGERNLSLLMTTTPPGTPENPSPFPVKSILENNSNFDSEEMIAYEVGYRVQPASNLYFSIDAFWQEYTNLRGISIGESVPHMGEPIPYIRTSLVINNDNAGDASGIETLLEWHPTRWWRLLGTYSYLYSRIYIKGDAQAQYLTGLDNIVPRHQASLRSAFNISRKIQLDLISRYVDRLIHSSVEDYLVFDARLGWRPINWCESYISLQNIGAKPHFEYESTLAIQTMRIKTEPYLMIGFVLRGFE